jgi:Methyltransferase domain/C-methyltransferase C-terminal domain
MIGPTSPRSMCPSCGCEQVRCFYEAPSVPVNSVLLLSSREEALTFPTGDIRLGFCESCGFIYNTTFDPTLVEYSVRCEESQAFSPLFRAWHEALARRLIDRYSLHGKHLVEIGCGKGEFLSLLCQLGGNDGMGFDPAYVPGRFELPWPERITFVRDFFSESETGIPADFVCCKMTLEHIVETGAFVRMVRRSLTNPPDASVFFQVPDVTRILEEDAFWDIYYEHCSYFSASSLVRLFRDAGFQPQDVRREYANQYVTIEARACDGTASSRVAEDDFADLRNLVANFATHVPERITQWRRRLERYREKGLRTVIWGAGSKGVAFVSTLNVPGSIRCAVDINPHMSAHYLAKSGLEIVAPSALCECPPDVVIVMNPIYREEIAAELSKLGLRPEVVAA